MTSEFPLLDIFCKNISDNQVLVLGAPNRTLANDLLKAVSNTGNSRGVVRQTAQFVSRIKKFYANIEELERL